MNNLTSKQQLVLDAVKSYWGNNGVPPSISVLAKHVGVSKATAYEHLIALKKKGYLESIERAGRTWRPTLFSIPLLGTVAAGNPVLATENIEDFIEFKPTNPNEAYFALKVQGDSMIDAHILPEDIIIVQQQITAKNGDIVVALIDNEEATVKELQVQHNQVVLVPKNDAYKTMIFDPSRIQILGKVIEVRRSLE